MVTSEIDAASINDSRPVAASTKFPSTGNTAARIGKVPNSMQWYLSYNGQQVGPMPHEQARARAEANPHGHAWREGFPEWLPIPQVKDLHGSLSPIPVMAPPLQSLPFSRLAGRMLTAAPQRGGSKGEGSVRGGIGDLIDGDNF
jgi:GYF domain 2